MSIFKAYDIRGIYPKELDEKFAFLIGQASARKFTCPRRGQRGRRESGVFVVGYDIRLSSKKLLSAFLEGLEKESKNLKKKFSVKNIGLSTSPMFYYSVNNLKASGGAMTTASHNPAEYGGFKIVGPKAEMVSGKEIEELVCKL